MIKNISHNMLWTQFINNIAILVEIMVYNNIHTPFPTHSRITIIFKINNSRNIVVKLNNFITVFQSFVLQFTKKVEPLFDDALNY